MDIAIFLRRNLQYVSKAYKKRIPLYYFLHFVLQTPVYRDLASWVDMGTLQFRINDPEKLAALWGAVKGKNNMTYAKLSRAIRYYYGKHVMEKVENQDFVYRFVFSNKTKALLQSPKNFLLTWGFELPDFCNNSRPEERVRKSSDGEDNESGDDEELFDLSAGETTTSMGFHNEISETQDSHPDVNMDSSIFLESSEVMDSGCGFIQFSDSDYEMPVTYFPDEFLTLLDSI